MKHPVEADLALYAGGELGRLDAWRIARHLRSCDRCRAEAALFRAVSEGLSRSSSELPPGLRWDGLAAEMKANIHLGLDAGEIAGASPSAAAEPAESEPRLGWRPALAFAALTMIIVSGWWLNMVRPVPPALGAGFTLAATEDGIELKEGESALQLRHPQAQHVTYSVNVQGAVRARYVDADSGQVTIQNVYAE